MFEWEGNHCWLIEYPICRRCILTLNFSYSTFSIFQKGGGCVWWAMVRCKIKLHSKDKTESNIALLRNYHLEKFVHQFQTDIWAPVIFKVLQERCKYVNVIICVKVQASVKVRIMKRIGNNTSRHARDGSK